MESAPSASCGCPAGTPHAWPTPFEPKQVVSGFEKRTFRNAEPLKYAMTSEKLLESKTEHSGSPTHPPLEGGLVGSHLSVPVEQYA
jgi:hypothetical protein